MKVILIDNTTIEDCKIIKKEGDMMIIATNTAVSSVSVEAVKQIQAE